MFLRPAAAHSSTYSALVDDGVLAVSYTHLQKFDETRASFLAAMKNLSGEMEVHLETHFLVFRDKAV